MNKKERKELMKKQGNHLIVKHNSLVGAKGKKRYATNELKLICNLVANVTPYDKDFETKKVPIRDLAFVEDDSENYKYMDNLCESLLEKPFKIPGSHLWVNWFSALGYKDGYIEYRFDKDLKPFLLDLKGNFTKYRLKNILNLGSAYSIHIYELLKQLQDKRGRTIYLDEFREILNIPKSYTNAHITTLLKKVQKDLAQNTDITFNFAYEKEGRKFNKINFQVSYNKNISKKELEQERQEEEYLEYLEASREPTMQDNQEENLFNIIDEGKPLKGDLRGLMSDLRTSNE